MGPVGRGKEEPMNEQGVAERAFGLGKGEGNARWWGGGLATIKATGKETGGLYSVVEVLEPQGARAPLHLHRKEDEAFYVLEGEVTFQVGEETIRGPAKARTLPPSEPGAPPDGDEAEPEGFAVLEARYGCEIVGTPSGHRPSREQGKESSMNEGHASKTYGLGEGEGEARWWLGGLATVKATGKETDGRYTLVEVLEPEGEQPFHVHHREDEGFWVLEGELTVEVGEETINASPGSFVFGPKDIPHRYTVESGPARMLFLLSPAGFEEFIYATSEPAKERTLPPSEGEPSEAEMEQLGAVARQ